jgi:Skp family chaperone for outer membrane proteins
VMVLSIYSSCQTVVQVLSPPSFSHSTFHCLFFISFSDFINSIFHFHIFTMQLITSLAVAAILASNVIAHPGQSALEMRQEIAERAEFMKHSKKDLSHCAAKMKARGIEKRAIARRTAMAKDARKKRGIAAGKRFSPL